MPDLIAQLRQYAEYAVGQVPTVQTGEISAALEDAGAEPGRGRRRRRGPWTVATAAAVGMAVVVGFTGREGPAPLDVSTRPGSSAPPSRPPSTAPDPGSATGQFAAAARAAGIPGPRQRVDGGVAVGARTIAGESFSVSLPEDLPGLDALRVVPEAAVGIRSPSTPRAYLTTLSPAAVAAGACAEIPPCGAPLAEEERVLATGATYTRWQVGSTERTVTLAMGSWTLVLEGPDSRAADVISAALMWSAGADGYVVLRSTDPMVEVLEAGVTLIVGTSGDPAEGVRVHVRAGCEGDQQTNRPAVADALDRFGTARPGPEAPAQRRMAHGGRWCAGGRYAVEVVTGDMQLLERLYAALRVSADGRR